MKNFIHSFATAFALCICIIKVDAQTTHNVSDACSLALVLNDPNLQSGDIVNVTANINLDALSNCSPPVSLPLVIPVGVILQGNTGNWQNAPVISYSGRTGWVPDNSTALGNEKNMYLIELTHDCSSSNPTVIKDLRIIGPNHHWQDDNDGNANPDPDPAGNTPLHYLTGGIIITKSGNGTSDPSYLVQNCEIASFSRAGIFVRQGATGITVEDNYIHHVGGSLRSDPFHNPGIGYGAWVQGENTNGCEVTFINNIFDDCKAAIDANSAVIELTCNHNTFFCNLNKHNGDFCFDSYSPIDPNCNFLRMAAKANPPCPSVDKPAVCINGTFEIYDCAKGNITVENNIFYNPVSAMSFPFPGNGSTMFDIEVNENTFAAPQDLPTISCSIGNNTYSSKHGYAQIADNYIEDCVWTNNSSISTTDNTFNYKPGLVHFHPQTPQPPWFALDLTDPQGNILPQTGNRSDAYSRELTQYNSHVTDPVNIRLAPLPDFAQNLRYVIRPNHKQGLVSTQNPTNTNITETFEATYMDEQELTAVQSSVFNTTCTSYVNQPGLHGIDVMAVDQSSPGTNNYGSAWQHIPVIYPSDDYHLIFNIKDSYHQFHHDLAYGCTTTCTTGVVKQARLNGQLLWQQDITEGGDGWERVDIDLTGNLWDSNSPILSILNVTEPDTLSFTIAINNTNVDVNKVRGVTVWIDNIYLKETGSPTGRNLIEDGTLELCDRIGIAGACAWDIEITNQTLACAIIPPPPPDSPPTNAQFENDNERFYPTVTEPAQAGGPLYDPNTRFYEYKTGAGTSTVERKSGRKSLALSLPRLPSDCYNFYPLDDGRVLASVSTTFSTTDLLDCNYLDPNGSNPFGFTLISNPCTTYSNERLYISQDITVQNSCTLSFLGCTVAMAPGVSITVDNGATLDINYDAVTNKGTRLFACGDMWRGIINNGTVFIRGKDETTRSLVEDALTAVTSYDGAKCVVRYADFNNNYRALQFNNGNYFTGNATTDSRIRGARFTCSGAYIDKHYPDPALDCFGKVPEEHILLQDVKDLYLGENTNSAFLLDFADASTGIVAINSSLSVTNARFSNLFYLDKNSLTTGIHAQSTNGLTQSVNIGTTGSTNQHCTFDGIGRGVQLIGPMQATITGNEFKDIEITGIGSYNNYRSHIINDNTFTNDRILPKNHNFQNTAITISYPANSQRPDADYIYNNTITNHRIGIHASGKTNLHIGVDQNGNSGTGYKNIINYNLGDPPFLYDPHYGIFLQNCPGAKVVSNEISNNATVTTGLSNFRGIDVTASTDCMINCNQITNLPYSMQFKDYCNGTILRRNIMTEYDIAINTVGATLPNQGIEVSPGVWEALDNEWYDSDPADLRVGDLQVGIDWFHQGSIQFIPFPHGFNVTPVPANSNNPQCDDQVRPSREERFGAAVGDSLQFDEYENENTYKAKASAFEEMKKDTTILFQGNSGDAAFQNFYADMSQTNIGSFAEVNALAMDSTTLMQAATLNDAIVDTNTIEYFKKTVNDIYLNKTAQEISLSSADSSTLDYIAHLTWVEAGEAIFQAAAMLGLEIHPAYVAMRKSRVNNKVDTPKTRPMDDLISVFPNPAQNKLFINGLNNEKTVIIVFDATGRVILFRNVNENSAELDISGIAAGFYRITIAGNSRKTIYKKVSVVR